MCQKVVQKLTKKSPKKSPKKCPKNVTESGRGTTINSHTNKNRCRRYIIANTIVDCGDTFHKQFLFCIPHFGLDFFFRIRANFHQDDSIRQITSNLCKTNRLEQALAHFQRFSFGTVIWFRNGFYSVSSEIWVRFPLFSSSRK